MRLHEITDASEYLLTGCEADAVTDELLDAAKDIRPLNAPAHRLSNDDRNRLDRRGDRKHHIAHRRRSTSTTSR
jgi:hypothetical protein